MRTTEDFGYQGEPPTHPELLDWLAVEFMKQGWSMKKLHRLIVTSATYRQSSRVTPELLARDPENTSARARPARPARGGDSCAMRRCARRACFSEKIGGPSVRPPQPEGVSEVAYGNPKWNASAGEDRYRRGLYTFAKRTAPYAMLTTFDATRPAKRASPAATFRTRRSKRSRCSTTSSFIEAAQALGTNAGERSGHASKTGCERCSAAA